MPKEVYVPLWMRILLLATLNVAVLAAVFATFLRLQLKPDLESFLMAEARERIAFVTRLIVSDLESTDAPHWTDVLHHYSTEYGLTILLYRNTGEQLAGPVTSLPPEVDVRLPRGGPPPPPPNAGPPPGPPPGDGGPGPGFNNPGPPFLAVASSGPRYWVGVRMPFIRLSDDERMLRSVLMFVSPGFFSNPFFFNLRPWLAMGGAALLITALCWLPLIRNLTRSIAAMKRATARIADGQFEVDLRARHDELGLLGRSIKQMAGRLQEFTEGRKRFLGDAAHELRSPIARMQLAAEILERRIDSAGRKYADSLKEDLTTMTRLTDELLEFARAEMPPITKFEAVNVEDAIRTAAGRESTAGIELHINVDSGIAVQANRECLVRALANIVRNAIWYAGDRGPIEVSVVKSKHRVEIQIIDSGPGIPEEELDRVFTPFYRLDSARDRRTGGTGLGLAIVRTCIAACGGAVECRNREPSGLEVIIRLNAA